ncbi:MAG TPA: response regulator transcription factor [Pseudonocardia sp.]|jgi:DNA-binding NarL/FixJ family response regulator
MIGVVVCDDHGIVRSGIRRILEDTDDLELLAAVSTGAELIDALARYQPDLAVLDIRLADGSGLDLLTTVHQISPRTRVVMLSMYGAKGYVEKARAGGARGYLTKECLEDELIGALRRVMTEDGFVSSVPPAGRMAGRGRNGPGSAVDQLSAREAEVLGLLLQGLTNPEIADRLCVSPRTVESHRAGVQRKLGVRTRAELARVAREAGFTDW